MAASWTIESERSPAQSWIIGPMSLFGQGALWRTADGPACIPGRPSKADLTRANRLVTCFEPREDVAGGVGEVGVEGEALAVDLNGR